MFIQRDTFTGLIGRMGELNEDVAEVLSQLSNMGYSAVGGAKISLGPCKQL